MTQLYEAVLSRLPDSVRREVIDVLDKNALNAYFNTKQGFHGEVGFRLPNRTYKVMTYECAILDENSHPNYLGLQYRKTDIEVLLNRYPSIQLKPRRGIKKGITWINVPLNSDIPVEMILDLIDQSYEIMLEHMEKRDRLMLSLLDQRPVDKAKIRALAEIYDLGHRGEEIVNLLQPAISIEHHYKHMHEPKAEKSRIGGRPDLPPGIEWPMLDSKSLAFLGQINLEEIPDFSAKKALPAKGILYFFSALGWGEFSYEESIHPENSKVIYFDGDLNSLQYTPLPEAIRTGQLLDAHEIRFHDICTLPLTSGFARDLTMPKLDWSEEEYDQLHDMAVSGLTELYKDAGLWGEHLLGYATPVQGQVTKPGERFLVSFTFFPPGSAVGWLYFVIKDEDLAHHNFNNVRWEVQFAD